MMSCNNYIGYHYASPNAFKSIIENKKLWFTKADCFEDKTEGKVIIDILHELAKENRKVLSPAVYDYLLSIKSIEDKAVWLDDINADQIEAHYDKCENYICCFSIYNDNQYMWDNYLKNDKKEGYCIGINLEQYGCTYNYYLEDVIYDRERQKKKLMEEIEKLQNDFCPFNKGVFMSSLKNKQYAFKDKKYSNENEVRVIRKIFEIDKQKREKLCKDGKTKIIIPAVEEKYRVGTNGVIIKYIETTFFPEDIIVTASPRTSQRLDENVIKEFIEKNQIKNITVQKSKIKTEQTNELDA